MIYILFNPHSGNGAGKEKAEALAATYGAAATLVDVTEACADYAGFFAAMAKEDQVIICGGDGTLNRFTNDTVDMEIDQDILYYATGTGNDFLRDLEKEEGCAPFSVKELLRDLPVVTVNGKSYRFLNAVGYGIDGYCCEVGDALRAKGDGKPINYTAIAIKGLLFYYKPKNAVITVDGVAHHFKKVWIAPTMFGRYYGGGMMPTPDQNRSAHDKEVSLMVFHGSGKLKTLIIFPSLFKGEHVKHKKHITIIEGYNFEVEFDAPCALQIDGETILGVTGYKACAKVRVPEVK